MVSKDRIQEEGLTQEDVLDRETVVPEQDVKILPEWEDNPEAAPGHNVWVEDDVLVWERGGFEVRLQSYQTTHWKAEVMIPKWVGKLHPREIDIKASRYPETGFVESADVEDYVTRAVTLVLKENFMPTYEVNKFIDHLIESAEHAEQFQDELEEKLSLAAENEKKQKQARTPGWSEEHEAFICPHCKETSSHVVKRDDGGADCVHCGESVDEYVASENEQ